MIQNLLKLIVQILTIIILFSVLISKFSDFADSHLENQQKIIDIIKDGITIDHIVTPAIDTTECIETKMPKFKK